MDDDVRAEIVAGLRNEYGTLLASDGRPVFNTETGESRSQYLARVNAVAETAERARLAAAHAFMTSGKTTPTTPTTEEELNDGSSH